MRNFLPQFPKNPKFLHVLYIKNIFNVYVLLVHCINTLGIFISINKANLLMTEDKGNIYADNCGENNLRNGVVVEKISKKINVSQKANKLYNFLLICQHSKLYR